MPTKTTKSVSTGKTGKNGGEKGLPEFVSCELDDAQKAHIKAHLPEQAALDATLDTLLRDGFKLSVRFEVRSMAYAVWLTGADNEPSVAGLVLSARGPSLVAALGVLFYKHFEVLDAQWCDAHVQGAKRDSWG